MNPMYDSATLPDRIPFGPAPPPGAEPETKAQAKPYDENEDLPCLLWDTVPDNPDNADLAAMQSLMYDECTAAERAENFKNRGNECMKRGRDNKYYLKHAYDYYTKALGEKGGDDKLDAVCLSNRAQAHLLLGNNRHALHDCKHALTLDAENIKTYFRAAKAAVALREFTEAAALAADGLRREPDAKELHALARDAQAGLAAAWEEMKRVKVARAQATKLAEALELRGVRLGRDVYGYGNHKPQLDDEGMLHWRLSLLYPESMQCDVVEDVHEGETLDGHLDAMFGESAPPLEWDQHGAYTRERVELYYRMECTAPLSAEGLRRALRRGTAAADDGEDEEDATTATEGAPPRWVKLDTTDALGEALMRPGHVVPGQPVLHVVAKGTEFWRRFTSGAWHEPA